MEYGLIAKQLSHSFSKEIHSFLADYDYQLKELKEDELEAFMCERQFKAINVTIPYKSEVIKYLDEIDSVAKEIGAVNTVVNRNGSLIGFNTDFLGMRSLIIKNGILIKGKKVLILGAGATSKTAFAVAKDMKAGKIYTVSRTKKENCITYDEAYSLHSDAQVIINTTPCGMYPNISGKAIDIEKFTCLEGAVDVVYNPLSTDFVLSAQKQGVKAVGGLYMLVAQAVYACEKFIDTHFDESVIDSVYKKILSKKQNIVLIGMPSCGKTTVGKILSEKLSRDFFDTDTLIEQKTGLSPEKIIKEQGEKAFRDIESLIVEEVSAKSGVVIATGGGAILREENRNNLHKNGVLCFIDRPLECLLVTDDRPLSSNREKLQKRYIERYPIYKSAADYIISGEMNELQTAQQIEKEILK